ncbi:MAG TPA: hypothetical protein VFE62_01705 [Gemmataceae bacterium]|nr:hypothetical protein [Gemmataceae bacterium]
MSGKDDHWQELADLLGLPEGEKPAAASSPKEPPPPVAPAPRELDEDRPAAHVEEEQPRLEPMDEDALVHEAEFDDLADETILDEPPLPDEIPDEEQPFESEISESAAEFAGTDSSPPTEEDRPKRRRRRRRGRRGGGGREGEERGERSQEPRRQAEPQQRGSRGDGRRDEQRQQRGESSRRQPEPEHEHEEEQQPRHAPVMDAADDFSDWNVPSWQELIASLYRPDR